MARVYSYDFADVPPPHKRDERSGAPWATSRLSCSHIGETIRAVSNNETEIVSPPSWSLGCKARVPALFSVIEHSMMGKRERAGSRSCASV